MWGGGNVPGNKGHIALTFLKEDNNHSLPVKNP